LTTASPKQKGGSGIGKTKVGKGSKIMAVTDSHSLPVAIHACSASPAEVTLVEETLAGRVTECLPKRLVADKAYDSDPLDEALSKIGAELIAPHKKNRVKKKTQDGRKLRRYRRRWTVERFFAWLQNYRRLVARYERKLEDFLGMVRLGCILILLRQF